MTTPSHAAAEAEIRDQLKSRAEAVKARDVDAMMAHHAPSVLAFDLVEPLQYVGLEALRGRLNQWFDGYDGPMTLEMRDLRVTAAAEVAFSHALFRIMGTLKTGVKVDMFWRATQCWRCIGGKWLIVHEHSSVPFNMETLTVSFGLSPDARARAA